MKVYAYRVQNSRKYLKQAKLHGEENYFFLKNVLTSEGAVSFNVLYYQQLSLMLDRVSFYANNYFE